MHKTAACSNTNDSSRARAAEAPDPTMVTRTQKQDSLELAFQLRGFWTRFVDWISDVVTHKTFETPRDLECLQDLLNLLARADEGLKVRLEQFLCPDELGVLDFAQFCEIKAASSWLNFWLAPDSVHDSDDNVQTMSRQLVVDIDTFFEVYTQRLVYGRAKRTSHEYLSDFCAETVVSTLDRMSLDSLQRACQQSLSESIDDSLHAQVLSTLDRMDKDSSRRSLSMCSAASWHTAPSCGT